MRPNRSRLNWGIFFIALGAVPLAVREGVFSGATLGDLLRLWPLVIVALGVSILLARTPFGIAGGMLLAACFGLVVGGAIAVGPQFGCTSGSSPALTTTRDGTFTGPASVELRLACGTATVSTAQGSNWHVGVGNSQDKRASIGGSGNSLSIRSYEGGWWLDRGNDAWQVTLPTDQSISLTASVDGGDAHLGLDGANLSSADITVNAGSAHISLAGARVSSLSITTNAGSTNVVLGAASDFSGTISTNAGSLNVCAPAELGLRIRSNEALAGTNLGSAGLVRVGDAWQTPGYDAAAHRASLSASTNLGSLNLNPAGGCN